MLKSAPRFIEKVFDSLTGEFILKWLKANGGAPVALRALWMTIFFIFISMFAVSLADPERVGPITMTSFFNCLFDVSEESIIFLGAAYISLDARFVSQWTYLAGLYNLIKQVEASGGADPNVIAEWKAGYLEDAENLHLAAKHNLAPIIHAWVKDEKVKNAYIKNTPGGALRLDGLIGLAAEAYKEAEKKFNTNTAKR